jgi:nicotinamide mononucleotide transporter
MERYSRPLQGRIDFDRLMSTGIGDAILTSIAETDLITWIATVTAVIYVLLALKESIWCWSFGIISSALWVSIYFHEQLWYESYLNVFYVSLGIYGWISWARSSATSAAIPQPADPSQIKISRIPGRVLLNCVVIALSAGILLGYIASAVTKNDFAYTDALLSSFSVVATWMTAKKYIENWSFWIVIDACSAVLYIFKGPSMYLAALLFIFYTFMAIAGYFAWKKNLRA